MTIIKSQDAPIQLTISFPAATDGLNKQTDPERIADTEVQDSSNVLWDEVLGGNIKRKGMRIVYQEA